MDALKFDSFYLKIRKGRYAYFHILKTNFQTCWFILQKYNLPMRLVANMGGTTAGHVRVCGDH